MDNTHPNLELITTETDLTDLFTLTYSFDKLKSLLNAILSSSQNNTTTLASLDKRISLLEFSDTARPDSITDLQTNRHPPMAYHKQDTDIFRQEVSSLNDKVSKLQSQINKLSTRENNIALISQRFGVIENALNLHTENIEKLNACIEDIEVREGDSTVLTPDDKANLLIANINRNILLADMERFSNALLPHGNILLSGFYIQDIHVLAERAAQLGMRVAEEKYEEEWAMILLESDTAGRMDV